MTNHLNKSFHFWCGYSHKNYNYFLNDDQLLMRLIFGLTKQIIDLKHGSYPCRATVKNRTNKSGKFWKSLIPLSADFQSRSLPHRDWSFFSRIFPFSFPTLIWNMSHDFGNLTPVVGRTGKSIDQSFYLWVKNTVINQIAYLSVKNVKINFSNLVLPSCLYHLLTRLDHKCEFKKS